MKGNDFHRKQGQAEAESYHLSDDAGAPVQKLVVVHSQARANLFESLLSKVMSPEHAQNHKMRRSVFIFAKMAGRAIR